MRIVVCCNVYPPHFIGGAELIAHQQAKALAALGHHVSVYTGDHALDAPRHQARDTEYDGLQVRRVRLNERDFSPFNVTFCHPEVEADFEAYLRRERPDVVHFHNVSGLSIRIISIARQHGARTVQTLHDYSGFCFKNTAMKTPEAACESFEDCHECLSHLDDGQGRAIPMRLRQDIFKVIVREDVDAYVSPSRFLADKYLEAGFDPARMNVLWNGIDAGRFARVERDPVPGVVRFSFFGHLGAHKGVQTLVEALPLLREPAGARLNLVGDGEMRQWCAAAAAASGCRHLVRFWGKLDSRNVEAAYRKTDVLVLPSLWHENQPVSITEAMACGIPVIASNMGGNPELVRHGDTGLLFQAGDVHGLAAAMQRLVDEPRLIERMGAKGRESMQRNTFALQAQALVRLYRSLARPRPAAAPIPIVACSGARFPEGADAVPREVDRRLGVPIRFVHAEWLDETRLREAAVRWEVESPVERGAQDRRPRAVGIDGAADAIAAAIRPEPWEARQA